MKTLKFFTLGLGLVMTASFSLQAQKNKRANINAEPATIATETKETKPNEDCLVNTSLFSEYAKVKNYADAYGPWLDVWKNCPSSSKNIYILGTNILNWKIGQATDAAEREELFQMLMKLFDDRTKYFGNDKKMPAAKILAQKAYYYSFYKPEDKATVYPWLKEAITKLGKNADPSHLQQFVLTSHDLYKADNTLAEQFINDYTLADATLSVNSTNKALRNMGDYLTVKQGLDVLFAASGVADCEKMNEIFLPNVESNKENLTYLESTMKLFKSLRCTENEAYFKAAEYSHNIKPSAESAVGLGNMCFSKGNYTGALTYYEEAVNLCTDDTDQADNYFRMALSYFRNNQYGKAREYCKLSLSKNANSGAPHILLGSIYATAKVSDDPTLQKSVYWAAVDQFIKAKNAEPTDVIIEQANKLIRTYSVHFPSTEELFMHPDVEAGKPYYVGGLVNETTTARAK